MSNDFSLFSSPFRIKSKNWTRMTNEAKKSLGDYYDSLDFDVATEHESSIVFSISFGGEAGDSFPSRIGRLMKVLGPFLQEAGSVTVRENTLDDERDQIFFAGPSQEAVRLAKLKDHLLSAQQALLLALPDGEDDSNLEMSAITGLMRGVMHSLGLVDKLISDEHDTRAAAAPKPETIFRSISEPGQQITVDTTWGELSLPFGTQFQHGLDGNILVAARTRDDGDADVLGSLNIQHIEAQSADARAAVNASMTQFISTHPTADIFQIVEIVPDVLSHAESASRSADLPSTGE